MRLASSWTLQTSFRTSYDICEKLYYLFWVPLKNWDYNEESETMNIRLCLVLFCLAAASLRHFNHFWSSLFIVAMVSTAINGGRASLMVRLQNDLKSKTRNSFNDLVFFCALDVLFLIKLRSDRRLEVFLSYPLLRCATPLTPGDRTVFGPLSSSHMVLTRSVLKDGSVKIQAMVWLSHACMLIPTCTEMMVYSTQAHRGPRIDTNIKRINIGSKVRVNFIFTKRLEKSSAPQMKRVLSYNTITGQHHVCKCGMYVPTVRTR